MKYENLFKIHIPEPCHEDWGNMTPNQQGAFCKVCSKTVVDFSTKSDAEVQKFLLENSGQKICGRFKINQLENRLENKQEEIPRLKIEKPKFEFPGFLMPLITPFRACAMSLMIFASAALMSCGNSDTGGGGGNDEHLAGAVAVVDSVETILEPPKMLGEIAPVQNDSACIIDDDDNIKVGKIKVIENTDTLKTDSTETMQGEIEPRIKMGMLKRVDPEEKENLKEKDYKKGEVKGES